MNETQFWYCNICDKSSNIKKKSKHIKSKSHNHKEKISVVVKEYEFIRPDINQIDSITDKCSRECYIRNFHKLKFKCIYDIEMTNGDIINGKIFDENIKKIFGEKGLYKNPQKNYWSLSNIIVC